MIMTESVGLDNAGLAFGLVIAAGLSTAVGAAAVYFQRVVKLASKLVLAAGLGFSAGIMIYVSFIEIFVKSNDSFVLAGQEESDAYYSATLCLFGGMFLMKIIAMVVHKLDENHNHHKDPEHLQGQEAGGCKNDVIDIDTLQGIDVQGANGPSSAADGEAAPSGAKAEAESGAANIENTSKDDDGKKLLSMGVKTAVAIAIHNFPEGLATFVATLADPAVGITLAVAIAIHNIPEGLCVALPVYYATGSRHKGFLWALFSGLSEPIGATLGYCLIKASGDDMNQAIYGILFGVVAGMMVMIVIMELMPTGFRYDPEDKVLSLSFALGMGTMAASLCLFQA